MTTYMNRSSLAASQLPHMIQLGGNAIATTYAARLRDAGIVLNHCVAEILEVTPCSMRPEQLPLEFFTPKSVGFETSMVYLGDFTARVLARGGYMLAPAELGLRLPIHVGKQFRGSLRIAMTPLYGAGGVLYNYGMHDDGTQRIVGAYFGSSNTVACADHIYAFVRHQ